MLSPFGSTTSRRARWEASPLINVFLVLLVTLALGAGLGMKKNLLLPVVSDPFGCFRGGNNRLLVITVSRDHTFFWNTTGPFPLSELHAKLEVHLKESGMPRVVVDGDALASFGDAAKAFNEVHLLGIEQVTLNTERVAPLRPEAFQPRRP